MCLRINQYELVRNNIYSGNCNGIFLCIPWNIEIITISNVSKYIF